MIQQLQRLFPSLIKMNDYPEIQYKDYIWFQTATQEIIGVLLSELTQRDQQLLEAFLIPYNPALPAMTQEEVHWDHLIHAQFNNPNTSITSTSFRFIFFQVQPRQIEPRSFKEAITELFGHPIPVLWINEHSGLLVETPAETGDEAISYEHIIDILMSDLYVNIDFFVGPIMTDYSQAGQMYQTLVSHAKMAFQATNQSVISYIEAIPLFLIHDLDPKKQASLVQIILGEFIDDVDMLKTLETFILNNMNVSTTAKKLYMHRNSLQYRLDKFIEKTDVDIRQFPQSMSVLLAISVHKQNINRPTD